MASPTQLSTTQRVKVGPITATTNLGTPAPVENIVITSTDETIIKIVDVPDNDDPTVIYAQAGGAPGDASLHISADAMIGDGEVPIVLDLDFHVTSALAGKLIAPVGDPEEIPAP